MSFSEDGYRIYPPDPRLLDWVKTARPIAQKLAEDPKLKSDWLRHGRTWFAGVNIFPNDENGTWPAGPALDGDVIEAARALCPFDIRWDTAQISIPYQGYPKQDPTETNTNHRFRKDRDAAHLDGLLPIGPKRRRHMEEYHAFVLGLPLNDAPRNAAPLVVWKGSHKIIHKWLMGKFASTPPDAWRDLDLTDSYADIRRHIFESCDRITIGADLGGSYLVDRFTLHGVAPWPETFPGPEEGRIVAYFRPHWRGDLQAWLEPTGC
ncbi:MAG: hypothetical protein AAF198_02195 [Pseudomonadota bacterium]